MEAVEAITNSNEPASFLSADTKDVFAEDGTCMGGGASGAEPRCRPGEGIGRNALGGTFISPSSSKLLLIRWQKEENMHINFIITFTKSY